MVKTATRWLRYSRILAQRKEAEEALRRSEERLAADLAETKLLQSISSQLIQEDNIQAIYEQLLNAATAIMHSEMATMQMLFPEKMSCCFLPSKALIRKLSNTGNG